MADQGSALFDFDLTPLLQEAAQLGYDLSNPDHVRAFWEMKSGQRSQRSRAPATTPARSANPRVRRTDHRTNAWAIGAACVGVAFVGGLLWRQYKRIEDLEKTTAHSFGAVSNAFAQMRASTEQQFAALGQAQRLSNEKVQLVAHGHAEVLRRQRELSEKTATLADQFGDHRAELAALSRIALPPPVDPARDVAVANSDSDAIRAVIRADIPRVIARWRQKHDRPLEVQSIESYLQELETLYEEVAGESLVEIGGPSGPRLFVDELRAVLA